MSSARMKLYVPLVQEFSGRVILFHSAVAQSLGLHATDLRALRLLGAEPMTAGALGEGLHLTGAATTALIDRLERTGYAVRRRDALDRRKVTIHAIPEKLREIDNAYQGMQARMSKLLSTYSATEFSAIADFLRQTTQVLADETAEISLEIS
jgi:DNA-binding MarR family transcriptional regulator